MGGVMSSCAHKFLVRNPVQTLFFWIAFAALSQVPRLQAQTATLSWNASTDPNLAGYVIYYGGASQDYTNTIVVGNVTNVSITGLTAGATYYFAATTYDSAGDESAFSNEATYTVPGGASLVPPGLNAIPSLTINENAAVQTINLSGISSGSTGQTQSLAVTVSSSNPSLIPTPTVNYSSPATTGTLSLEPVANATGSATITVTVNNGAVSNNLVSQSFTVTVNPIPTLNAIAGLTLNENAAAQTVSLSGITSGSANQSLALSVTASSSNPALIPNPTVNYSSPAATGSLTLSPAANAAGSATITVTVTAGGVVSSQATQTFTVSVNPAPTLNAITNVTLNENTVAQTVGLSGISSGAANENLALSVAAVSSNPALIPNPTVKYSSPSAIGSLILTPAANAAGSATITVTVAASGTTNQASQSFTVTVNPVPTLNALTNLTINENSPSKVVSLSGISSGVTNQSPTLAVTASSSDTSLIPNPTVTYTSPGSTGNLSFKPAANAIGTSIITVTVKTSGSGSNQVSQSFTVTVVNPNAPQITKPLANLTALAGQTISLSITATNPAKGSLTYAWKHNGTKISGTSSSLSLSSVTASSAGVYTVTVANTSGTNSSSATLTVASSAAASLTPASVPSAGQFNFTVTGITGYKYAVQATTDMVHWTSLVTNTAPFVFTDGNSTQFGQRFYRTVYVP